MKPDKRRFERKTHANMAPKAVLMLSEEGLLKLIRETPDALVLILDCVQDPHNLGACFRTADAAGAIAIVCPRDKSVGLTETVRHVASGAAETVPFVQVVNLARTLDKLKEAGLWLVGTTDQADKDIYDIDLSGPIGLVMGAEGQGLRRLTAEKCDFLAGLPMYGTVPCLNVSVATGICLYEIVRQRRESGGSVATIGRDGLSTKVGSMVE
jgi:23S rRNA (guanosine2251-2'-O)-methyltransferase